MQVETCDGSPQREKVLRKLLPSKPFITVCPSPIRGMYHEEQIQLARLFVLRRTFVLRTEMGEVCSMEETEFFGMEETLQFHHFVVIPLRLAVKTS